MSDQPLEYLWTPAGYWTDHERTRSLSAEDLDVLLAESNNYRLVEAKTGAELRWYRRGEYGFWHHCAKLQMQERGYAASEWIDSDTGERAILLQQQ